MSARYKYELNAIEFDNPQGWDEWTTDIARSEELLGVVLIENGEITFSGEAYSYLYTERKLGYCNYVTIRIWEDCTGLGNYAPVFSGLIFLSECEFDITDCEVKCTLVDDSYFAKVSNNKSVECSINAGKSKNGQDVDLIGLFSCVMFNPCDGVDSNLPNPRGYSAHDVGKYILSFITDNEMGFESTALAIGGEFEGLILTKGLLVSDPANANTGIIFTWESYIRNVCRACNLRWFIRVDSGTPVFVLEKNDDVYPSTIVHNFDNVNKIVRKIDSQRNYATVEFGTDDIIESLGCGVLGGGEPAFPDQINLIGCKREQFAVTGTCNIDANLDLTLEWVVSSNVLENIFFNGDTGYEEKVIIMDCDNIEEIIVTQGGVIISITYVGRLIKHDVFGQGQPPYYFNANYFNQAIAKRNLRGIPSTLVKYLNFPDTGFLASYTATEVITTPPVVVSGAIITFYPFPFGDDFTPPNFDLANDYGNGTAQGTLITQANSRYTAPADNVYKFEVKISYQNLLTSQPFTITYERFDAANTLIATYPVTRLFTPGTYTLEPFTSPLIFLNTNDYIYVRITWEGFLGPSLPVTFELLSTGFQGGTFEVINTKDYIADQFMFSAPLTLQDFYKIQSRRTEKITANDGKNFIEGWIDNLSYDRNTMMAEVTLINDGR